MQPLMQQHKVEILHTLTLIIYFCLPLTPILTQNKVGNYILQVS